nr:MAG TPA: hypothetical protein [Herelleviridae sp.]
MATDFLGQNLNIGDDVIFLNYNRTSADLKRGKITKVFPHAAEIGRKRRAEYKIIKILTDVAPVVRCKDCEYSCKDANGRTCEGYWQELSEFAVTVQDDDFCSHGKRKEDA